MQQLLLDDAKRAVKEALADVARRTSAEVIVSVRASSGSYRHADYLGGALLALAVLCAFLYLPEPFDYTYFPLEQVGAFILGVLFTSSFAPLRRLLAGSSTLEHGARTAARAAFVELGVGKTPQRNGVLVYVSSFESALEVVCDVGIDEQALGKAWIDAKKKLERSLRLDRDVERFVIALKELGPVLATLFPRDGSAVSPDGEDVKDAALDEEEAAEEDDDDDADDAGPDGAADSDAEEVRS